MVREGMKRRLAAVLSSDVAGYSRLMSADDRATLEAGVGSGHVDGG